MPPAIWKIRGDRREQVRRIEGLVVPVKQENSPVRLLQEIEKFPKCGDATDIPVTIPRKVEGHVRSLRERLSDLPLLVEHIIAEDSSQSDRRHDSTRPPRRITVSPEVLSRLATHHWPGNARELQNALRCAIIKCKSNVLRSEHLPKTLPQLAHDSPVSRGRKPKLTADSATQALEQAGGRPVEAARLLGVSRATLYRHLLTMKA